MPWHSHDVLKFRQVAFQTAHVACNGLWRVNQALGDCDIVALVEANETKVDRKRGPYNKNF
jgi:hypothetical protein